MDEGLTLIPTLTIMALSVAVAAFFLWYERRPREFGKMRLPTTPFLFAAILVVIVMCAHLLTLMGAPAHGGY
jgi:hypothetical protein